MRGEKKEIAEQKILFGCILDAIKKIQWKIFKYTKFVNSQIGESQNNTNK